MRTFSLDLCTGGIEVPLCDTWLKHVHCDDNPGNPSYLGQGAGTISILCMRLATCKI